MRKISKTYYTIIQVNPMQIIKRPVNKEYLNKL